MTEAKPSNGGMSRELMGFIVDEVFDGAIEHTGVIEEIYAAIKNHEAAKAQPSTEERIFNVAADDENGQSFIVCAGWTSRAKAERTAAHYRETYLGKPFPNGKGRYSVTAVRIVKAVMSIELIPDCSDPSAPPVFVSLDPSHQTQMPGIAELMKDGFLTCVAEPGRPFVKINFPTLKQAQALHEALAKATTEGQP